MKRLVDMPDVIPIFPLEGALVLPRGRLPLNIFEPRYLAMIEDCLKSPDRLIGMIQPRLLPSGAEALQAIGCAGRLTSFNEGDDGRYFITLTGVSRFRVGTEVEGFTPYRRIKADWAGFERDRGAAETDPDLDRRAFVNMLKRYFRLRDLETDWSALESAEDELLINALSMICPFSPEDRQALLESPRLSNRRETLTTLIEFALHSGETPEEPLQ